MKTLSKLYTFLIVFGAVITLQAQNENDDLYFNSKDLKKKKEEAAERAKANPDRTYYTYPSPASSQAQPQVSQSQQDNRFSDPSYSNKYIEAERNENKQPAVNQSATTINNYYGSNNNNSNTNASANTNPSYRQDLSWYDNNNYKMRRRAYGSNWSVVPTIGWNSWSGMNMGVGFVWNSGWNSWYGWNTPYYNGFNYYDPYWNNYGYSYGGGGCWGSCYPYGYRPSWYLGWNNWYGAYGGYNAWNPYGFGGYGYGGYPYYGSPYGYGYPVVYVPERSSGVAPKVNYGPINNGSVVTNPNGYSSNNNGNLERPGTNNSTNGQQRVDNGSQAPSQYKDLVRPQTYYNNPQPSSSQPQSGQPQSTQQRPADNRGYDMNNGRPSSGYSNNNFDRGNSGNQTTPSQREDNFSRPNNDGFRGYDRGNGGRNDWGGGGSNQRSGGSFGGGGGGFGGGGGGSAPSGGGGGGLSRPR